MSNNLFTNTGFNLDFFQFYNWGTFNNKIYTLNTDNKSSVLIGDNGSGKTTLVDAILTLLVPTEKRYYNQSSGETNKKDRSEDTYVLGAYGNRLSDKDDSSMHGVQNFHRKKENTISILNGCFTNEFEGVSYSLLQIRYYTASALNQVYAIIVGKVTIEQIIESLREQNAELVKSKNWKNLLLQNFNIQFYPSFKQYSAAFSGLFGLRSDKALKLFSQIVGLKVLGDIDTFIKYNMLEEGNILTEFDNLQDNYQTLLHCSNEIKKTKVQIDLFKAVSDIGIKYQKECEKMDNLKKLMDVLPFHYTRFANEFLKDEQQQKNKELTNANKKQENTKKSLQLLEDEITSLNNSITNDSNYIRLNQIENEIANLKNIKDTRKIKEEEYAFIVEDLRISFPKNEKEFNLNIDKVNALSEKESKKEIDNDEKLRQIINNIDLVNLKISDVRKELESLGTRDSNIPSENIIMRNTICRAVKCEFDEIPFVGELIDVKEEDEFWKKAIEKVLHNVALTLLVPEKYYKKVSTYVNDNDMKGRVVYLKVEDSLDFYTDDIVFDDNTIGTKLKFKETNINILFLKKYIKDNFSYVCAQSIAEYTKCKKAITSSGLIKNGLKNEKDDRQGRSNKKNWVLGWSNKVKKQQLSLEFETLTTEHEDLVDDKKKCDDKKIVIRNHQNLCHDILKYDSYDLIDVEAIVDQIDKKEKEKSALLASNKILDELKKTLDEKKRDKEELEELRSKTDQLIGKLGSIIENLRNELEELNKTNLVFTKEVEKQLLALNEAYPILSNPKNLAELKKNKENLTNKFTSEINGSNGRQNSLGTALQKAMNDALNPTAKLRDIYGDWSVEFPDLAVGVEYLPDFCKIYERLIKDDLPKYTKQFHEYLHTSLQDDFTNFKGCINNQANDIKLAIDALNKELARITYNQNPDTYLTLLMNNKQDADIREFNKLLKEATPNAFDLARNNPQKEEEQFEKIQKLLNTLNSDERFKKKVLDIRNWYYYGAEERTRETNEHQQYYYSSSSISGGEKTKLTYTILGSAISYQFGIAANNDNKPSFKFVIIDEAFSKIDPKNSAKVMEILKELDIQVMAVTPVNNIDIIEDYISSITLVEKDSNSNSVIHHLGIKEYKENKDDIIRRAEEKSN